MLQDTVRERYIKAVGAERQKSRIGDHTMKRQTQAPLCRQHRPETGIKSHRQIALFRCSDGPPSPTTAYIEQHFALASRQAESPEWDSRASDQ